MSLKKGHGELMLEVTVLSAESLKKPSSLLHLGCLRPYVTVSSPVATAHHHQNPPLYRTRVDEAGAGEPTWRDTLRLPVGPSFVRVGMGEEEAAAVHVSVLSNRRLGGPVELGWCHVRPSDVVDGLRPPGALRRLSYALRSPTHGGRGHGILHLAVRLLGHHLDRPVPRPPPPAPAPLQGFRWGEVALGIPVAAALPAPEWARNGGARF